MPLPILPITMEEGRTVKNSDPSGARDLKCLVGDIGASYRRRMLPPLGLVLAAMAAGAAWMQASPNLAAAAAGTSFLVTGCVVNWPRRRRLSFPGWRTVGLLASAYAGFGGALFPERLCIALLALGALAALADMGLYVLRTFGEATRLAEQVEHMDEHDLLALLPDQARDDARRWQAGDDSKAAELAVVIHLGALWMALELQRTHRHEHGMALL